VGRDRALGVLLGITMMWLVFERLFPRSAGDEMVRIFVINTRLLADIVASSPRVENPASVLKVRRQRDEIYRRFGEVNAQSDAVPFETGPLRAGDMAARDRIRRWQASLRSFYLLQAPLLQFRIFARSNSRSSAFTEFEDDFRLECQRIFLQVAAILEKQLSTRSLQPESVASLGDRIGAWPPGIQSQFTERERALMRMIRTMAQVVDRLTLEVASEGVYDAGPAILPDSSASLQTEDATAES